MPLNFLEQLVGPVVILVLVGTIITSYLVFKKTQSMRLSLLPTLIPPLGTLLMMALVAVLNTDNSGWTGLGQIIIAIMGVMASVIVFAITAIMLAVLKKNLKK